LGACAPPPCPNIEPPLPISVFFVAALPCETYTRLADTTGCGCFFFLVRRRRLGFTLITLCITRRPALDARGCSPGHLQVCSVLFCSVLVRSRLESIIDVPRLRDFCVRGRRQLPSTQCSANPQASEAHLRYSSLAVKSDNHYQSA